MVEEAAFEWFEELGYTVLAGPEIAFGEVKAERTDPEYRDMILEGRVRQALARLNPDLPPEALDDAFRKLTRIDSPSLITRNRDLHSMLVDGVNVEYPRRDGSIAGAQAWLVDFENPENNDWLVVNQFTVAEGQHTRRPDIVIFLNGLPIAVIELKNPADENATIWSAFNQLQTYKAEVPALFVYNALLIISDGLEARVGSLSADREWFMPWRTIEGEQLAPASMPQLQVLIEGLFEKRRLLDFLRHFIVFEDFGKGDPVKKIAGYHQFHAVNKAIQTTLKATRPTGDRRAGVVSHARLREKPDDGVLRGAAGAGTGDAESHHRCHHRPQRFG